MALAHYDNGSSLGLNASPAPPTIVTSDTSHKRFVTISTRSGGNPILPTLAHYANFSSRDVGLTRRSASLRGNGSPDSRTRRDPGLPRHSLEL